jgi:hypothetical protein
MAGLKGKSETACSMRGEGAFEKLRAESKSGLALRKIRLAFLKEFDWGHIRKLGDVISSYLQHPPEKRMEQYHGNLDPDLDQALYEEEIVYGKQLTRLSDELAVIALYRKLEIDTKKALKIVFPQESPKTFSYWRDLKRFLVTQGIDITLLPEYSVVNELRLINNCLKHSGVVDKELGAIDGWNQGKDLEGLGEHLYRLAEGTEQYMSALIDALHSNLRENESRQAK